LNVWQTAVWGLNVYTNLPQEVIAKKVGLSTGTISNTKILKEKLSRVKLGLKRADIEKGLQNGLEIRTALGWIEAAEQFDAKIESLKEEPCPRCGNIHVGIDEFVEEMIVKYAETKYQKPSLKRLETDFLDRYHPLCEEEKYYCEAKAFIDKSRKLEEKFEENVAIMTVVSPEDYREAATWITELASENRGFTCICFFYLPEKMVKGDA
jgi:hypothetical protein